jgi:hypothetical protein
VVKHTCGIEEVLKDHIKPQEGLSVKLILKGALFYLLGTTTLV